MGRRRDADRVVEQVDTGQAELVPDPDRPGSWTLLLDGAPQSHVDLTDPTHLEFEYVRRLAAALDLIAPAGAPLRVLHLGGGALTLPRYVQRHPTRLDPAGVRGGRRAGGAGPPGAALADRPPAAGPGGRRPGHPDRPAGTPATTWWSRTSSPAPAPRPT